jgi:hypothetical protein
MRGLLERAGLAIDATALLFLLDRAIERLPDATAQEVGAASFRRPPYDEELLEDRLASCALTLRDRLQARRDEDPILAGRPASVASRKTMGRRRLAMAEHLAALLRERAARAPLQARSGDLRPIPGDRAEFLGDLSVPDGTLMRPGEVLTKRWGLRNAGSVPWVDRYLIRLGTQESRSTPITAVRVRVADTEPGRAVEASVDVTAPPFAGTYEVHWKMADSSGRLYYPDRYWAGVWFTIVVPGPH